MANTHIQIGSYTVGSSGSSAISFNTISQDYTDLRLVISSRTNNAGGDYYGLTINGNASNLSNKFLTFYSGTTTGALSYGSPANKIIGVTTGATYGTGIFGGGDWYFASYSNNTITKAISGESATEANGSDNGEMWIYSGAWSQTNAITDLVITPYYGTLFVQNSVFTLYGIKNT